MVNLILISWRDIPSQVIVQRGRTREKAMLSARFQEAIDRAADLLFGTRPTAVNLRWALDRASRSGRTARQFVDDFAGREALARTSR